MPDINVETILFMSIVKSLSVGNGDMFYIQHNSDNFTVIDCFLSDENKKTIMDEIIQNQQIKTSQDLFQPIQMKIILKVWSISTNENL